MEKSKDNVINEHLSLENGAVDFWEQKYKDYQISVLYNAFKHYGVPIRPNTRVAGFSEGQKAILFYGVESDKVKKMFSEVIPLKLWRMADLKVYSLSFGGGCLKKAEFRMRWMIILNPILAPAAGESALMS